MRLDALALAVGVLAGGNTAAQHPPRPAAKALPPGPAAVATPTAAAPSASAASPAAPAPGRAVLPVPVPALQPSLSLRGLPRGDAARDLPVLLQADGLQSQPDLQTLAEGKVDFRRGGLLIRADRLVYDAPQDLATAKGNVRIVQDGAVYSGPELQLKVQRFEGYFLEPEFQFTALGAGGRAERVDFIDRSRLRAVRADYTSCPRDDSGSEPAWLLRADSVAIDLDNNEGVAEGVVLRFLSTPILAVPRLSFPLSDARKSGWLPPTLSTDSRSGIEVSAPYYWNIAPNRDATFVPRLITRRGVKLDTEFRYLQAQFEGTVEVDWLPHDTLTGNSREAVRWQHEGRTGYGVRYAVDGVRVSDDDWWKDFPNASRSLAARLLPLRLTVDRPFELGSRGQGLVYAQALQWQVLQGSDAAVISPYQRSPQVGVRLASGGGVAAATPLGMPSAATTAASGWPGVGWLTSGWPGTSMHYAVEAEYNRFTLPSGAEARAGRSGGERVHLLGHVGWTLREAGWWVAPRFSVNAARYRHSAALAVGEDNTASRVIPTFSVDAGIELDRTTTAFGRAVQQTLEPRVLYVRTPFRAQSQLPNYDAAAKDFNFVSIYTDNQFAGIDRVSDANQLTAGVTTRFVDVASGAEALRLGLVQRVLFTSQRVAPQADGSPDGPALTQRFSDALLLGSTGLVPNWALDAAVQYRPDIKSSVRTIVGARYSPGPFRTVGTTYRFARGLSEQVELGWQWPVAGAGRSVGRGATNDDATVGSRAAGSGSCSGTWYSVGRVNYSLKDSRIVDSVLGAEYDAGCWIGRVVAERLSTGRSEATTRLLLQLELVGLSRLGSNPLRVLKDNIPGYRLLRDDVRRGAALSEDRPIFSTHE